MIEYKTFQDYLERSGDDFKKIYPAKIFEEDEHGFCTMDVLGDVLMVYQCYGDGRHWHKRTKEIARNNGCKTIKFITKRNPKVAERKYGFKIEGYLMSLEI